MGKVVFDITTSLDGFVAGPKDSPNLPMGKGGLRLFDWYFAGTPGADGSNSGSDDIKPADDSRAVLEGATAVGVIVSGRRTYNNAHGWNGEHPMHVPVFVVTHQPPDPAPEKFNGRFIADGVESAIRQAQAEAGDKIIAIASPTIAAQCLKAGLLDEISLHVIPVLLGDGVRLFDHLGADHIELERTGATAAQGVTHIAFRVVK